MTIYNQTDDYSFAATCHVAICARKTQSLAILYIIRILPLFAHRPCISNITYVKRIYIIHFLLMCVYCKNKISLAVSRRHITFVPDCLKLTYSARDDSKTTRCTMNENYYSINICVIISRIIHPHAVLITYKITSSDDTRPSAHTHRLTHKR